MSVFIRRIVNDLFSNNKCIRLLIMGLDKAKAKTKYRISENTLLLWL